MTNKEAIEQLKWVQKRICEITYSPESFEAINLAIKALEDKTQGEWIPIKTRELTEEEKEEYPDCEFAYDCKLPDDGEEVLVTSRCGYVALYTFCIDEGCYFENYCDDGDVIAWQHLPKPYKEEGAEE